MSVLDRITIAGYRSICQIQFKLPGDLLAEAPQAKVMTLHKVNGETRIVGEGQIWEDSPD